MRLFLNRLWIQLSADRRKFGALGALLLLGLLLWSRIIVISNLPRTVVAGEDEGAVAATRPPPRDGSAGGAEARPMAVEFSRTPRRDPFVISPEYYPKEIHVEDLKSDPGKSGTQAAEDAERAEARLTAQLRRLAEGFRLEAVMTDPPMAVINGNTYRQGSWIPAVESERIQFRLAEVRPRMAILECEGRRFELRIPTPGG